MVVQPEEISARSRSELGVSAEERRIKVVSALQRNHIKVLGRLSGDSAGAISLANQLSVEQVIDYDDMHKLLQATYKLNRGGLMGAAIEIERPDRTLPTYDLAPGFDDTRVNVIRDLGSTVLVGKCHIPVESGVSTLAVVSMGLSDPLMRDVIKEGADPTAMQIAQRYDTPRLFLM